MFLLVSLLFLATGCRMVEQRVIYGPDRFFLFWKQPAPSELTGLDFEEAHFSSMDGTRLHGWFIQPANIEPNNVILFAHGRSGNITSFKSRLFDFVKRFLLLRVRVHTLKPSQLSLGRLFDRLRVTLTGLNTQQLIMIRVG